jgi:hypothetical protein
MLDEADACVEAVDRSRQASATMQFHGPKHHQPSRIESVARVAASRGPRGRTEQRPDQTIHAIAQPATTLHDTSERSALIIETASTFGTPKLAKKKQGKARSPVTRPDQTQQAENRIPKCELLIEELVATAPDSELRQAPPGVTSEIREAPEKFGIEIDEASAVVATNKCIDCGKGIGGARINGRSYSSDYLLRNSREKLGKHLCAVCHSKAFLLTSMSPDAMSPPAAE